MLMPIISACLSIPGWLAMLLQLCSNVALGAVEVSAILTLHELKPSGTLSNKRVSSVGCSETGLNHQFYDHDVLGRRVA